MYKTVGIYQNIQDENEFEQYYINEILPRVFRIEGVVKLKLTSLLPAVKPYPEEMKGLQLIVETYFESREVVDRVLLTAEGKELMSLLLNREFGEIGLFVTNERTFKKEYMK